MAVAIRVDKAATAATIIRIKVGKVTVGATTAAATKVGKVTVAATTATKVAKAVPAATGAGAEAAATLRVGKATVAVDAAATIIRKTKQHKQQELLQQY